MVGLHTCRVQDIDPYMNAGVNIFHLARFDASVSVKYYHARINLALLPTCEIHLLSESFFLHAS